MHIYFKINLHYLKLKNSLTLSRISFCIFWGGLRPWVYELKTKITDKLTNTDTSKNSMSLELRNILNNYTYFYFWSPNNTSHKTHLTKLLSLTFDPAQCIVTYTAVQSPTIVPDCTTIPWNHQSWRCQNVKEPQAGAALLIGKTLVIVRPFYRKESFMR